MKSQRSKSRVRAALWLVVGALSLSLFATSSRAAEFSDPWITTKVKISLLTDDVVPGTAVNVDTVDGRVTLHGTVGSEAERARAGELAGKIQGARTVQNLLQVVPASRKETVKVADGELKKNVQALLARDKALENSSVKVSSVNDGVVLLSGKATTLSVHRRAIEDARAVPGVRQVSSQIESPDKLGDEEISMADTARKTGSAATSAAYDAWITTDAKARLLASPDVPALQVNVDTSNGVVTLFGSVPSEQSKRVAETEVKKIEGVKSVKNDLQIVPKADAKRVEESDDRVSDAIDQRLEARSELNDSKIGVQVENGVARLTGSVASQSDRMLAMTTVRGTPGVRSVIDSMKISIR